METEKRGGKEEKVSRRHCPLIMDIPDHSTC